MKKHKVVPLESIEIEFLDKTLLFTFDMMAITKLQEKYGPLEAVSKSANSFEMAAIMLWAGVKDEEFTLDEAKVIVVSSAQVLTDTLTVTYDSVSKLGGEEVAKKIKEEMEKLKVKKA